jgi:hypothetical protein
MTVGPAELTSRRDGPAKQAIVAIQLDFMLRRLVEMAEGDAALRDRQP